mmetsp:Transcript_44586/g.80146  ORF Transcript_44586/g.80146 Transcript_44586/m.80146 type:complete len:81 (+) Transcript_44586:222-464(+)
MATLLRSLPKLDWPASGTVQLLTVGLKAPSWELRAALTAQDVETMLQAALSVLSVEMASPGTHRAGCVAAVHGALPPAAM